MFKQFVMLYKQTSRHEMFWTHWDLSALRSFYGLAALGSETEQFFIANALYTFHKSGVAMIKK
jgi:hypothetical protein